MSRIKKAFNTIKETPTPALIASLVIPGGVAILGLYFLAKTLYKRKKYKDS